ncbi:uncharacterized protein LOC126587000 [Malus sylvestris]|uniref:uncharacterized protein LOC126587000 n=1 Tax=Malus sylvestris TaxID=3752 RepID=UPI0021AC2E27|nr:uncharacterized protein LOC126587000 [Malus sylvestris]
MAHMKMMQKRCPKRPSLNKCRVRPVIQLGLKEMAKFEANKVREEAKAATVEKEFQANQRERELLRQERELVREERMAQRDREIMNTPLEGKSPNSKYFWKSEKEDAVCRRRAREARARGNGPSSTNWLSDDE